MSGMDLEDRAQQAREDEIRAKALYAVLDRLGADGVTAALNDMPWKEAEDDIYKHVLWLEEVARAQTRVKVAKEIAGLEDAILRYAQHTSDCDKSKYGNSNAECSCGASKLVRALREKKIAGSGGGL